MAIATASYSSKGIGGIGLCLPANTSDQLFETHVQEFRHLSSLVTLRGYNTSAKDEHHQFRCSPDSRAGTLCGQHSASWLHVVRLLLAFLGFRNVSNGLFKWWHTDDTLRTNYEVMAPSHTLIRHVQKLKNQEENPKPCGIFVYMIFFLFYSWCSCTGPECKSIDQSTAKKRHFCRATIRQRVLGFNVVCFWKRPPSFLSFSKNLPQKTVCLTHGASFGFMCSALLALSVGPSGVNLTPLLKQ